LIDADEERLIVTSVFCYLLQISAEVSKVLCGADIALEQNDGADSVVTDQGRDVLIDASAVKSYSEQLCSKVSPRRPESRLWITDLSDSLAVFLARHDGT
jgi:hypothetical protein